MAFELDPSRGDGAGIGHFELELDATGARRQLSGRLPQGDAAVDQDAHVRAAAEEVIGSVGADQRCGAPGRGLVEPLFEQLGSLGIEPDAGFVEQYQLGLAGEGLGQHEAAAHAARELAQGTAGVRAQPRAIQERARGHLGSSARLSPHAQEQLEHRPCRELVGEGAAFGGVAEARAYGRPSGVSAQHVQTTPLGGIDPGQQSQQGRLARAVGADEADHGPARELQVHAPQDFAPREQEARSVAASEAVRLDGSHGCARGLWGLGHHRQQPDALARQAQAVPVARGLGAATGLLSSPASMAQLVILDGPDPGRAIDLAHGQRIGRLRSCEVAIVHASISREHARVELRGDDLWIVDMDSSNGLRVAGQRVREVMFEDGLEFALGGLEVRFAGASAAEPLDEDFEFDEAPPQDADAGGLALEDPAEIELAATRLTDRERALQGSAAATPVPQPPRGAQPTVAFEAEERRAEVLRDVSNEPSGLLRGDLTQYPGWVQALLLFSALVFFAAVSWGAFTLIQGAKG